MKTFQCGSLVPGCGWETTADAEAEVIRRAVNHLRSAHGETTIRESMIENIQRRVRDEEPRRAAG